MALSKYNNSVVIQFDTTTTGNAGSGKTVTVYLTGTLTKALLFDDQANQISNPVITDDKGNYGFLIDAGEYDIVIDEGLPSETRILKEPIVSNEAVELNKQGVAITQGQEVITLDEAVSSAVVIINGVTLQETDGAYSVAPDGLSITLAEPLKGNERVELWVNASTPGVTLLPKDFIKVFDNVGLMASNTNLFVGDTVLTKFFGADVECFWTIVEAGTGAGDMTDGTLNLLDHQAKLEIEPIMTPKHFGAVSVANGGLDDTQAIQNCADNCPYTLIDTLYDTRGNITFNNYVTFEGDGELRAKLDATNPVYTMVTINSTNFGDIKLDGNGIELKCLVTQGAGTYQGGTVRFKNVTASDTAKNLSCGMLQQMDTLHIDRVITEDFLNDGHDNDSFPQSFVGDTDSITHIGQHSATDSVSGIVVNAGTVYCGTNRCVNMADNGVYTIDGETYINDMYYFGNEEPLVNVRSYLKVGKITTVGSCFSVIRHQTAIMTEVGEVFSTYPEGTAQSDIWDNVARGVFNHRSTNNVGGNCTIGMVRGTFYELFARTDTGTGSSDTLYLSDVDVDLIYRRTASWSPLNWFNVSRFNEIHVKDVKIRIIDVDDALTSDVNDYFYDVMPTFTRMSTIENFDISILGSNRQYSPVGVFRGERQQEFLRIDGATWQVNVGPYRREWNNTTTGRDSTLNDQAPTAGYWRKGQRLFVNDYDGVGVTNHLYMCSASGSGGATWVAV